MRHLNSDTSTDTNASNVNSNNNDEQHPPNTKQTAASKHHQHPTAGKSLFCRPREPLIDSQLLLTASDYKNAGNKLCSLYRYEEAISYYSKAITKNSEVAIFFSNRALCHLKLQQWTQAIQDCRRALELDPNLIKAHFFLGQALAETLNYDEALKHLQNAHELAKELKMNFGDDIAYQIRLVKKYRWNKIEEEQAQLETELHNHLVELLLKDKELKLHEIRRFNASLNEGSCSGISVQQPATSSSTAPSACVIDAKESEDLTTQQEAQEIALTSKCDKYIDKLDTMFNNLRLQRKKREVPDYLCGKISFEIMHDPVITPSGVTYDRRDIEEHLKKVGHFDPVTRQPLNDSQLISNLAMKEVVDAYLNENEWALYY